MQAPSPTCISKMALHEGGPATWQPAPTLATTELPEEELPISQPANTALPHDEIDSPSQPSTTAKALESHVNQLLLHISPSPESLAKRKRVVEYVQKIVQKHFLCIGYEVRSRGCSPAPPSASHERAHCCTCTRRGA